MKEFKIDLQKRYYGSVYMEAKNKEEAEQKAIEKYMDAEIEWEDEDVVVTDVEQT